MRVYLFLLSLLSLSLCSYNSLYELSYVKNTQQISLNADSRYIYFFHLVQDIPPSGVLYMDFTFPDYIPKGVKCFAMQMYTLPYYIPKEFEANIRSKDTMCVMEKNGKTVRAVFKVEDREKGMLVLRVPNIEANIEVNIDYGENILEEPGRFTSEKGAKVIDLRNFQEKGIGKIAFKSFSSPISVYYSSKKDNKPKLYLHGRYFEIFTDEYTIDTNFEGKDTLFLVSPSDSLDFSITPLNSNDPEPYFYNITEVSSKNKEYREVTIELQEIRNVIFMHQFEKLPEGNMANFGVDLKNYGLNETFDGYKCVTFESGKNRTEIEALLNQSEPYGVCYGEWAKDKGDFNALVNFNNTQHKGFAILFTNSIIKGDADAFVREHNEHLYPEEGRMMAPKEELGVCPFFLNLSEFRELGMDKFLLFRFSKDNYIYMNLIEEKAPQELYHGNFIVMDVSKKAVTQKYHGLDYMIVLLDSLNNNIPDGEAEDFSYEIKFFQEWDHVQYLTPISSEGRTLNRPIQLELSSCETKWYFFYNYQVGEKTDDHIKLYIEKVYGEVKKIKYNEGYQETWDEQIEKGMTPILNYQHTIDKDDLHHVDLFEIDCQVPTLLNLYYVNKKEDYRYLAPGDTYIKNLKFGENLTLHVDGNFTYTLEVYHPYNAPKISYSAGEKIVKKVNTNYLIEYIPIGAESDSINIRELNDSSMTRVIVKVTLDILNETAWVKEKDGLYHNKEKRLYVYEINGEREMIQDIKQGHLYVKSNETDLSKVCYAISLGAPISPSEETCFKITDQEYETILIQNALIRYDYYETEAYHYYISVIQEEITGGGDLEFRYVNEIIGAKGYHYKDKVYVENFNDPYYPTPTVILEIPDGKYLYAQVEMCNTTNNATIELYNEDTDKTEASEKVIKGKQGHLIYKENNLDPTVLTINDEKDQGEAFVRHTATQEKVLPFKVESMNAKINKRKLSWVKPFGGLFKYVVYYRENGTYINGSLTLCDIARSEVPTGGKYSRSDVEFTILDLGSVKQNINVQILAKQQDGAQVYILSEVFTLEYDGTSPSNDYFLQLKDGTDENFGLAEGSITNENTNLFFYYDFNTIPEGGFSTFRLNFENVVKNITDDFKCTFVSTDVQEKDFNEKFNYVSDHGVCNGSWAISEGRLSTAFRVNQTAKRFVIKILNTDTSAKLSAAITKKSYMIPGSAAKTQLRDANYKGLMPYIINLEEFEHNNFKQVLIYKYSEAMQVYYLEDEQEFPTLYMSGHILVFNTDPRQIQRKYKNKKTLIILAHSLNPEEGKKVNGYDDFIEFVGLKEGEEVEYLRSTEPKRKLNQPIELESSDCKNTKYVIYNYGKADTSGKVYVAHIDPMYGKEVYISIATQYQDSWERFKEKAFHEISNYQYELKANLPTFIDVYKVRCKHELAANVFYVEKGVYIKDMNEGDVLIKVLAPREKLEVNVDGEYFYTLSIWHPNNSPNIEYTTGYTNASVRINEVIGVIDVPDDADKIVIQEKIGDQSTRIIIKVGHRFTDERDWVKKDAKNNIYFKPEELLYVYQMTDNSTYYNIYKSRLGIKTDDVDNVKFCYTAIMGAALGTSNQNCFRIVDSEFSDIQISNPLVRYNSYETFITDHFFSFKAVDVLGSSNLLFNIAITSTGCNGMVYNDYPRVINSEKFDEQTPILLIEVPNGNYVYTQIEVCNVKSSIQSMTFQSTNIETGKQGSKITINKGSQANYIYYSNEYIPHKISLADKVNGTFFIKHVGVISEVSKPQIRSMNLTYEKKRISFETPFDGQFEYILYIADKDKFTKNPPTICDLHEANYSLPGIVAEYHISTTKVTIALESVDKEYDAFVLAMQKDGAQFYVLSEIITFEYRGAGDKPYWINVRDEGTDPNFVHFDDSFSRNNNPLYMVYSFDKILEGGFGTVTFDMDNLGSTNVLDDFRCLFVHNDASYEDIEKIFDNTTGSACYGEWAPDKGELNAVYKMDPNNTKLVLKFLNPEYSFTYMISIPKNSTYLDPKWKNHTVIDNFQRGLIPYYIKLKDYSSADIDDILLYKKAEGMFVYYLDAFQPAPVLLFDSHILSLKTDEHSIHQKYRDADTLYVLAHSLDANAKEKMPEGEEDKFQIVVYLEEQPIHYLTSPQKGRTLNMPIHMQMDSCKEKAYFIYNYLQSERIRKVHIDMIYGKIKNLRISRNLSSTWEELIKNMETVHDLQFDTMEQTASHLDIIEVECSTISLMNFYYSDVKMYPTEIVNGQAFVKSFTALEDYTITLANVTALQPFTIEVHDPDMYPNLHWKMGQLEGNITENMLYTGLCDSSGVLTLKETGNEKDTRVIIKLGHQVYSDTTSWEEIIKETLYKKKSTGLPEAFYIYVFPNDDDRYAYKKISLPIKTTETDFATICYSINLGAGLDPSFENCFRITDKAYTNIEIINPLVQYKTYITNNEELYVSLKVIDLAYDLDFGEPVKERLPGDFTKENKPAVIDFDGNDTSITLQSPGEKNQMVYVQLVTCAHFPNPSFDILDVYSRERFSGGSLKNDQFGQVEKYKNTLIPTQIKFSNVEQLKGLELFIKHTGVPKEISIPKINKISIRYTAETKKLQIFAPFESEFVYDIYFAKNDVFTSDPNICNITLAKKEKFIKIYSGSEMIDIGQISELSTYDEFTVVILAKEQINAKLYVVSPAIKINKNKDSDTREGVSKFLIVLLIIGVLLVVGIVGFFLYKKFGHDSLSNDNVVINDSMGTSLVSHSGDTDDKNPGNKMALE